jgi:hypothetical protein
MDNIPEFSRDREGEFPELFKRKTQFCSQLCSFAPGTEAATDAKTRQLKDLLKLIQTCSGPKPLSDDQMTGLYDMIEANLIRRIVPIDVRLFQQDDIPPMLELGWTHLALVYQILSKLLALTPKFPRHQTFAAQLLPVADSPDPNERAAIELFYCHLLRSVANALTMLTQLFSAHVRNRVHGTGHGAFLVSTVLTVFNYMNNELSGIPNWPDVFVNVILPLLSHPLLAVFQSPMNGLVTTFLDGGASAAPIVARYLLAKWPWAVATKQVFFIDYLCAALERMKPKAIEVLVPAMRRVFEGLGESLSEKVASALVGIWTRSLGEHLSAMHGRLLIPILAGPIADLSVNHWSVLVRQNARIALSLFQRRDYQAVQAVAHRGEEQPPEIPKWVAIINTAYHADGEIVVKRYLARLSRAYQRRPPPDQALIKLNRPRSISERAPIVKPALPPQRRIDMNSD